MPFPQQLIGVALLLSGYNIITFKKCSSLTFNEMYHQVTIKMAAAQN
jgi:hypothetical protein